MKSPSLLLSLVAAVTMTFGVSTSSVQGQIKFVVVPDDSGSFEAVSVSDAGAVIGGRLNGAAALWSPASGFELIGGQYFMDLSGDGNAALVTACCPSYCFWVRNQGCAGGPPSELWAISRNGLFAAGYRSYDSSGCSRSAVWYSPATGAVQEVCVDRCTYALGCSDDGSVVVGQGSTGGDCGPSATRAFKWTVGGAVVDICPGAAVDVTANGQIVVGNHRGESRGFKYETHSFGGVQLTLLQPLPGFTTSGASKVSSDGRLILGISSAGAISKPTLWAGDRIVDVVGEMAIRGINLDGWTNMVASDLSKDGNAILGNGVLRGQQRAWVLTNFESVVSGVIPVSGPAAGGTNVVVSGYNFSGTPKVLFGNIPALNVTVVSPTQMRVTTPPNLPGNCAISIDWATTPDAFYYRPNCTTDANNDGVVDSADLGILLSEWGSCQYP